MTIIRKRIKGDTLHLMIGAFVGWSHYLQMKSWVQVSIFTRCIVMSGENNNQNHTQLSYTVNKYFQRTFDLL